MEEMTEQLRGMLRPIGASKRQSRRAEHRRGATSCWSTKKLPSSINEDEIKAHALHTAGTKRHRLHRRDRQGRRPATKARAEVSRQGVQRDLLPLVEGTSVSTKYGVVKTDHILFVASGAFHLSETQRPDRGVARSLSDSGGVAIAVGAGLRGHPDADPCVAHPPVPSACWPPSRSPSTSAPDGITRLAQIAFDVNERTENIGARRLATVMERLLDDVSFDATALADQTVVIDARHGGPALGRTQPKRRPLALHLVIRWRSPGRQWASSITFNSTSKCFI